MAMTAVRLTRSRNATGDLVVRLGVRLLDEYLRLRRAGGRPGPFPRCHASAVGHPDCLQLALVQALIWSPAVP